MEKKVFHWKRSIDVTVISEQLSHRICKRGCSHHFSNVEVSHIRRELGAESVDKLEFYRRIASKIISSRSTAPKKESNDFRAIVNEHYYTFNFGHPDFSLCTLCFALIIGVSYETLCRIEDKAEQFVSGVQIEIEKARSRENRTHNDVSVLDLLEIFVEKLEKLPETRKHHYYVEVNFADWPQFNRAFFAELVLFNENHKDQALFTTDRHLEKYMAKHFPRIVPRGKGFCNVCDYHKSLRAAYLQQGLKESAAQVELDIQKHLAEARGRKTHIYQLEFEAQQSHGKLSIVCGDKATAKYIPFEKDKSQDAVENLANRVPIHPFLFLSRDTKIWKEFFLFSGPYDENSNIDSTLVLMQIIRKKRQFPLLEIIYLIFDNHRTQQSNVFIQALEWLVIEKGALGPKGKVIVYYLHKGHHDFRDDQEFSTLMSILHKHMETANINTITAPEQVLEAIRASLQANHAGVAEYLAEFFDWTIFFSGALDLPSISSFFQIKIQNSPLINERGIFTTSSFSELDQYSIAPIRLLKHCPPGFPTFCEIPQYSPSRLLDLKRKYFSLPISSNDQKEFMWKLISGKPINEITKSTVDYSDFEGFGYVSSTPKVHPPFINHLLDKNDEKGTREKQAITPSKALAESEALEARGPAHPWIHHLLNYRWDFSNQLNLMEIVFEVICRTENGRKDEARWADILLPDKSAIYPQFHEFVSAKFHDSWSTIAGPMKPPHIAFEEKEFQLNPTYTHKKKSWKKKEKP